MHKHLILLLLSFWLTTSACYYDNKEELFQYVQEQECNITAATYATDIAPILESHCIRCHRNGREDGNVNLEGFQQVKPYADNGSLYGTTNHDAGYPVMPTDGFKIPACEIEQIRVWVEMGAPND